MQDDNATFSSFLHCPHKALLQIKGEAQEKNALEFSIDHQYAAYKNAAIQKHLDSIDDLGQLHRKWTDFNKASHDGKLIAGQLDNAAPILAEAVENNHQQSIGHNRASYIPLLFVPTNKISKQQKLALAFAGRSLSKAGCTVTSYGKIIHGDNSGVARVQLGKLSRETEKIVETIKQIKDGIHVPPLILNSHCKVCRFSNCCRAKALEKDDLSLISSLSKKEILKLNKKGIFSVTQLSHTYRPRRRKIEAIAKHAPALKALAIREKKIYIAQTSKPQLGRVRVYFDVEGIPDKDFYYLIGAKVVDDTAESTYSFWADERSSEERIWREFLTMLSFFESFSLFHFGSYESDFVFRMLKRYGASSEITADRLKSASINVLTYCYLNIYFPTYSNSLKELGTYLKFSWKSPGASGLDSIDWRYQWENSRDQALKDRLLRYNLDDCEALNLLTNAVLEIMEQGTEYPEPVVSTDSIRIEHPYRLGRNSFVIPEFDYINKCAYFDYQRAKVYWRTDDNLKKSLKRKKKKARRYQKINKVIRINRQKKCIACKSRKISMHSSFTRTIYDIRFTTTSVKKWTTKFVAWRFRCLKCGKTFAPDDYAVEACKTRGYKQHENMPIVSTDLRPTIYKTKYGRGLLTWIIYQLIGLRQSHENITMGLNEMFGFGFGKAIVAEMKYRAAEFYCEAYEEIKKSIQGGRLVHVDETRVSVKGAVGYVWVFTNLEEVLYIYSDSREGGILAEVLKDFKGIMVTDFYTAYDSVPCLQQRCLIHLIRDFNDDLFKNPFDEEFKGMVEAFGRLLKPIMATIDLRGLKTHFFKKHKEAASKFFAEYLGKDYSSELARKYQTRLKKNQDRLFTFLNHDGVPWNNNNAENAIKGFATLRRVIGGSSTESGLRDSLKLLSIAQTLRNKNISFLEFLKSGERSLSQYLSRP